MAPCVRLLVCFCLLALASAIRHQKNLIWAQTPAMRLTVSRLVGIEGEPATWVISKKPSVKHVSAPHYRWEFKGLGFSYRKQLLVWSESMNKRIQSLKLDGSTETTDVFTGTSSQALGLAVDWLSNNVYWGDEMYNWIMMAPLTPPAGKNNVYRIVAQDEIDLPHGLAVYPNKDLLFFTEWGIRPRIEVCGLLGEDRRILVDTDIRRPRGLALSVWEERLYWVDSDLDRVESILLDGTDRKLVAQVMNTNFFGVAVYQNLTFVTDQEHGVLKVFQRDQEAVSFTLGNVPYGIIMYDESLQPGDSGPCDTMGCEHMCVHNSSDPANPVCLCGAGYDLMDDSKHCQLNKQFVHPSHLYAIGVAICQYPANVPDMSLENVTLTSQCFLNDRYGYLALTFDARENMLYYSGNYTNTISAIPLEVGAKARVIAGGTGVVKGLALDWVTGNLYWTDSTNAYIKMARKDGAFQRILIDDNLNSPLGIAVHPEKGLLFWTDVGFPPDIGASVEKANLDGTGREVIMGSSEVGSPNHMFLDVQKNELYWSDSVLHMVRRYYIATGEVDTFFQLKNVGFYGISIFKDFILWTDTSDMNGIHMAHIAQGRKVRGIIHPKYGVAADLITFDLDYQPNVTSPCNGSACSQLCLPSGADSFKCACGLGFKLAEDQTTCASESVDDHFILINDAYQKQVYQVSAKNGAVGAVNSLASTHEPIAVDFDPTTFTVYWSDNTAHVIGQTPLKGVNAGTPSIYRALPENSVCDGIAVDYRNSLLYFTDTGRDIIAVTSLRGQGGQHTLITQAQGLDEPRDIVVAPHHGLIFWSDWGKDARISRANMDGTDIETVVSFNSSAWPNGLALDSKASTLYYVEAQNNAIGVYYIYTKVHRIMVQEPASHYFGLFVMGDYLYLTDWRRNYIGRLHKNGGVVMQFGPANFTKLYGIHGFNSSELIKERSACEEHRCEHICVPKSWVNKVCLCLDGYVPNGDRCIPKLATTITPNTTSSTTTKTTTKTTATASVTAALSTLPAKPSTNLGSRTSSATDEPEASTNPADVTSSADMSSTNGVPRQTTGKANTTASGERRPFPRPGERTDLPKAHPSTNRVTLDTKAIIAIVVVSALVAVIAIVVVVVIIYRRRQGYTVPHSKLRERASSTGSVPHAAYFHNGDSDAVLLDAGTGIENPTYDITQAMMRHPTS